MKYDANAFVLKGAGSFLEHTDKMDNGNNYNILFIYPKSVGL